MTDAGFALEASPPLAIYCGSSSGLSYGVQRNMDHSMMTHVVAGILDFTAGDTRLEGDFKCKRYKPELDTFNIYTICVH